MKKLLPLMACLMLLTACGANNNSSKAAEQSSAPTASSTPADNHKLTFLEDGEIYIDFNFNTAPAGLSIKIGDTTLTASGKAKMSKDFTYEINGTFAASVNIYSIVDTGEAASANKADGMDAEVVKSRIETYFGNYSSKQYEYRIYFCLSDKANGWSTTLPGVDETIKSYSGLK